MKLLIAILFALPAILCWELFPRDGAVEKDIDTLWRVTAYCPCSECCGTDSAGITASGHRIREGDRFVAAPLEIPFYTRLVIPGYAGGLPVPVLDRGGAIKGKRLDVFFPTHQEALNWGIKHLEVRFVK